MTETLPDATPVQDAPTEGVAAEPPETEVVDKTRIACDGGTLGHPRVWLAIDPGIGFVECGYCDKRYILKGGPADR